MKEFFKQKNTLWPDHAVCSGSIKVQEYDQGEKRSEMFSLDKVTTVTPNCGRFPASKQNKVNTSDKWQASTLAAWGFALFSGEDKCPT